MELVNHPEHYNKPGKKECIVEMEQQWGKEITCVFCLTNAFKYLYRAGDKPDNSSEQDINKAKWYYEYAQQYYPVLKGRNNRRNRTLLNLFRVIGKELRKYD